jgi:hypothetical protein
MNTAISSSLLGFGKKGSTSKPSKLANKALEDLATVQKDFSLNLEDIKPADFFDNVLEPLSQNRFCVDVNLDGVKAFKKVCTAA